MHQYEVAVTWRGNRGTGTSGYRDYGRESEITADSKPLLAASADPAYRGDASRWNPEELLVASVAQCHMLWFLHLAAVAGVVVVEYVDNPIGMAEMAPDGTGRFTEVLLRPAVTVTDAAMTEHISALHDGAHTKCLIASSVNFPIRHEPVAAVSGS